MVVEKRFERERDSQRMEAAKWSRGWKLHICHWKKLNIALKKLNASSKRSLRKFNDNKCVK